MARLISKQEAAKMLDVTYSTITNWVKRGIIKTKEINGYCFVDKCSITKYFDSLKEIRDAEMRIAQMKDELENQELTLQIEVNDILNAQKQLEGNTTNILTKMFMVLFYVAGCEDVLSNRDYQIVLNALNGMPLKQVAEIHGLSREGVAEIINRAVIKMSNMTSYAELCRQKEQFELGEIKVKFLEERVAFLKMLLKKADFKKVLTYDETKTENYKKILLQSVFKQHFTKRVENCLRAADISIVADIVRHDRLYFLHSRNFGIKSLREIEAFLEDNNLKWEMDVDEIMVSNEYLRTVEMKKGEITNKIIREFLELIDAPESLSDKIERDIKPESYAEVFISLVKRDMVDMACVLLEKNNEIDKHNISLLIELLKKTMGEVFFTMRYGDLAHVTMS